MPACNFISRHIYVYVLYLLPDRSKNVKISFVYDVLEL